MEGKRIMISIIKIFSMSDFYENLFKKKNPKKNHSIRIFSGQKACISCSRWVNDFLWSM